MFLSHRPHWRAGLLLRDSLIFMTYLETLLVLSELSPFACVPCHSGAASVLALTQLKQCFSVSKVKVQRREASRVSYLSIYSQWGPFRKHGVRDAVQREHSLSKVWIKYTWKLLGYWIPLRHCSLVKYFYPLFSPNTHNREGHTPRHANTPFVCSHKHMDAHSHVAQELKEVSVNTRRC